MVLIMVAAGALLGAGLLMIVRGLVGVSTPLDAFVAELHRPRVAPLVRPGRLDSSIVRLAGRPSFDRDADLAACERTAAKYVQDRLVWAGLGATPGGFFLLLSLAGVLTTIPPAGSLLAVPAGFVGGWLYARIDLRSDAERARREFRHALAAYLELVTILMSGGAGVETAMFDAAAAGRGSAFRHLRSALTAAQARRDPPWQALGQLGQRIGVSELAELEASMTLAGGGALVRESLTTKAAGIRMRDLARIESDAQSKSETMVLPVALMFAGFLLLIGYPALAGLSGP